MFVFGLDSGLNVYRTESESYACQNGERVGSSRSYVQLLKTLREKRFISGDEFNIRLQEHKEWKKRRRI